MNDYCIICRCQQDYICEDHFDMLTSSFGGGYTLAVLGALPREHIVVDHSEEATRPAILAINSIKQLAAVFDEWEDEGDDIRTYKLMLYVNNLQFATLSSEDWNWLKHIEGYIPMCILTTTECYNTLMRSYEQWTSDTPLNMMVFTDWNNLLEYLRDWTEGSRILPLKILKTEDTQD